MTDRRRFFRRALGEAAVFFDELSGRPQLKLTDLPGLADDKLQEIVPVLLPGVRLEVVGDGLVAHGPEGGEPRHLSDLAPSNILVVNHLGHSSLRETAEELTRRLAWPYDQSFAHVRSLFLRLVELGLAVPRDPLS